jgi:PPIC-type peptidyl-prolyl cis-trans isomerase-like protein
MNPHRRVFRSFAGLLSTLPLFAGCAGEPMPLEEARNTTVVEAGGAKLTGGSLEGWLMAAAQLPGDSAVGVLVSAWIDEALLATAMQRGPALDDSATVDAAILPDAIRGSIREFWGYTGRATASDAQVDSLIELDRVRVFQQLQLSVPAGSDSAALRRYAGRAADLQRRALQPGSDFRAMVREASEDSIGRAHDGFLPATTREQLPPPIARALWSLEPGGVSPALRSEAGFHIFRRATPNESREGLRTWLNPRLAQIAERRFTDSTLRASRVELAPDALARVRAIAREPVTASAGGPLASWTGGALLPATARGWVMMLSPVDRVALSDASDSATRVFINDLVRREVLFAAAVPGGGVTARARSALAPAYRVALDSVKSRLLLVGGTGSPDPASTARALVDSVVGLKYHFRPLPGGLAGVLRARYPVAVDTAAIGVLLRASRSAWQKRHAADTAADPPAS